MKDLVVQYVHTIDENEYNSLRKSVGWNELSSRQVERSLHHSSYFVAARHNGKAIGMARLVSDGGYIAYIADVIVLPEYQGRGIGNTMINMLMQHIQDNMCEGETVFVNLMAAKDKEPFYRKFGFMDRPSDRLWCRYDPIFKEIS